MAYDDTDPDADGVVEADVDNAATTTESLDIAGVVVSANDYDDETDGIDAAMNDLPSRGGTVLIPAGKGGGPNGEYVISDKYQESDVYRNRSDVPIGVKANKEDVTFLGVGDPQVTVDASNPCYMFLVSSFANVFGRDPGDQVENVTIKGIDFKGQDRNGIPVAFYESIDCSLEDCHIRDWDPVSAGPDANFQDDIPVRCIHHADHLTVENNVFTCTTDITTYCKFDGTWGARLINNRFETVSGQDAPSAMFRQNYNGDFSRTTVGTLVEDNVFDQRALNSGLFVTMEWGIGSRIVDNDFLKPLNSSALAIKLDARTSVDDTGRGGIIKDNHLQGCGIQFANDGEITGVRISANTYLKTASGTGEQFCRVVGGGSTNGAVNDIQFKDNYFHVETDGFDAVANTGRYIELVHANAEGWDVVGNRSYGARAMVNNPGGADLTTWYLARNDGFTNSLYGGQSSKHGDTYERGTETDAVAIGSGDSTGNVTVSVSHNVDVTPTADQIEAYLTEASAQDYVAFIKEIRNIGSSSFDVVVHIDSLCSTADETVDVSWRIEAVPDWAVAR